MGVRRVRELLCALWSAVRQGQSAVSLLRCIGDGPVTAIIAGVVSFLRPHFGSSGPSVALHGVRIGRPCGPMMSCAVRPGSVQWHQAPCPPYIASRAVFVAVGRHRCGCLLVAPRTHGSVHSPPRPCRSLGLCCGSGDAPLDALWEAGPEGLRGGGDASAAGRGARAVASAAGEGWVGSLSTADRCGRTPDACSDDRTARTDSSLARE